MVAVELAKPLQNKGFWHINGLWVKWRPVGDGVTQPHKLLILRHLIWLLLLLLLLRTVADRGSSFQSAISMVRLAGVQLARDTSEQTRASLSSPFVETKACSMTRAKSEKCALQSRAERYRLGKTLRSKVSRESHAGPTRSASFCLGGPGRLSCADEADDPGVRIFGILIRHCHRKTYATSANGTFLQGLRHFQAIAS